MFKINLILYIKIKILDYIKFNLKTLEEKMLITILFKTNKTPDAQVWTE